ncbi:MAG TPA: hypothetical protein VGB30_12870 [bacterium]|jgi:hypothetical protein
MANKDFSFDLVMFLVNRQFTKPAWIVLFFVLLVCLVPFAGLTSKFSGSAAFELDPFGLSLLTPTRYAFGPNELLLLFGFFLITLSLIEYEAMMEENTGYQDFPAASNSVVAASVLFTSIFFVLGFPIIAQSRIFPGIPAMAMVVLDAIIVAAGTACFVKLVMNLTRSRHLKPMIGFTMAGVYYFSMRIADSYLIEPQTRNMISPGWSTLVWHAIILVVMFTLLSFPYGQYLKKATN